MLDIITIGGATRDVAFLTNKGKIIETKENITEQSLLAFEYGSKIESKEVYFNFGGGAYNASITFSKMKLKVAINCKIGNDSDGKFIIENLQRHNINTSIIQIDETERTGFSFIVLNKNIGREDRVIFVYKGSSANIEIKKSDIEKTKWIYLTSLSGNWEKNLNIIFDVAKNKNVKIAWNPGIAQICAGKQNLNKFLKNTEILIINKDEAIELVQSCNVNSKFDFNKMNNSAFLVEIIRKWGPKIAVVTEGENGAYLCNNKNTMFLKATSDKKVDSTGAGDSFGSALVSGYIMGKNIETALKYGIINSGSVVSKYGAQYGILNKEEIEKRLKNSKLKVSYL